jgi:hypothetical protein
MGFCVGTSAVIPPQAWLSGLGGIDFNCLSGQVSNSIFSMLKSQIDKSTADRCPGHHQNRVLMCVFCASSAMEKGTPVFVLGDAL